MKYYLHSVDTMDDEKVSKLFQQFGYEGTGLFHAILEKLAKQEKPIETSVLKYQLKVGKRLEKCWKFMEEIGIISSNNGDTFNKQLLNYSEKYQIKKEKTAKKVREWRENQNNAENVTCYETICNQPKVKESKVKESKVKGEENPPEFKSVIYSFEEIEERLTAETFIDNFAAAMKTDPAPAREFIMDWIAKKKLSGDYCYPIARLRSFLIADFEKSTKTNGFYGNSKKSARAERFLGDQDIEGFKGF